MEKVVSKKDFDYLEYIGNKNQLISLTEGVLTDGETNGVNFFHVENGGNLSITVLPDRGMDIYQVHYKGKNMNYIAPQGIRNSLSYDEHNRNFLRNFFVGQLTTVGLQNIGVEKEIDGMEQGLHGRINNTRAENVFYQRGIDDGKDYLIIQGTMKEARIFGENLALHRFIRINYEEDKIFIKDIVTNNGYVKRQFALLYHLNYGYPLLDSDTKIIVESEENLPRTEEAKKYLSSWDKIEVPTYPYEERCYFHKIKKDEKGMCKYIVWNPSKTIGAKVEYSGNDLPYFCEWKMLGKGEYVLGMEPMNTYLDGPAVGAKGCKAPILEPGESKEYDIIISYIDKLQ